MSNPRVSIVTPSYNQGQFLEQTILSVLNQDYGNIDYMLVDGASSDNSRKIIEKYANRLAWWVSEPDSGQPEAVNKGWSRAKGEIIGWLNSDDLLLPDTVSRFVKAFEEHPEAGIVFGDAYSIDAEGQIFNLMTFGDWNLKNLMAFDIICQPAVLIRREVLEKAGFLEQDLHYLMDHHLWLRLSKLAPMIYLPGPAAAARYHAEAKNVAAGAGFGQEAYRLVNWMLNQPDLAATFSEISANIWAGAHRLNARYLLDAGKPAVSLSAYWKCFLKKPAFALKEWQRIVFAFLSLFGMGFLKEVYYKQRLVKRKKAEPQTYCNISNFLKKASDQGLT